jgi:hypothetical protein
MNRLILILILFLSSCTTVKYVMVDPKDSTKLVEIKKRILYDDVYYSPSFMYTPMFYNWYTRPIYSPRIYIAPRPDYRPRQVPQRPNIEPPRRDPFPKPIPNAPIRQFNNQPNRRN